MKRVNISELVGQTMLYIYVSKDDNAIVFRNRSDEIFLMTHQQEGCEDVYVEDITGDLSDLIWEEILIAEEVSNSEENKYGSETWTFYKIDTRKGGVTIRWCGSSNGFYSERVDILRYKGDKNG